jgi:hypothetical protein
MNKYMFNAIIKVTTEDNVVRTFLESTPYFCEGEYDFISACVLVKEGMMYEDSSIKSISFFNAERVDVQCLESFKAVWSK